MSRAAARRLLFGLLGFGLLLVGYQLGSSDDEPAPAMVPEPGTSIVVVERNPVVPLLTRENDDQERELRQQQAEIDEQQRELEQAQREQERLQQERDRQAEELRQLEREQRDMEQCIDNGYTWEFGGCTYRQDD